MMETFLMDMNFFLPEAFVLFSTMALLLLGVSLGRSSALGITLLAVLVLVIALNIMARSMGTEPTETFGGLLIYDRFTQYVKMMILVSSALVLLMGKAWLRHDH
ncbi:MAG: hypothetical protein ACK5QI_07660, partial [Alphaproteobacteria bacterium]